MNTRDESANKSGLSRRNILLAGTTLSAVSAMGWATPVQTVQAQKARAQTQTPSAPSGQQPNHHNGMKVQCNFDVFNYYAASEFAFINLFKTASGWGRTNNTESSWTYFDENGYPTSLPEGSIQCAFRTYGRYYGRPPMPDEPIIRPGGYIVRGKGTGTIRITGMGVNATVPPEGPNGYWQLKGAQTTDATAFFQIIATGPAPNHLRDIVVMHEDDVERYDSGKRFTEKFVNIVRNGFGAVRFMNYLGSYSGNHGFQATKEDIYSLDYYTYAGYSDPKRIVGTPAKRLDPTHFRVAVPPGGIVMDGNEPKEKQLLYAKIMEDFVVPVTPVSRVYRIETGVTTKIFCKPNAYIVGEFDDLPQLQAAYPPANGPFPDPQGRKPLAIVGTSTAAGTRNRRIFVWRGNNPNSWNWPEYNANWAAGVWYNFDAEGNLARYYRTGDFAFNEQCKVGEHIFLDSDKGWPSSMIWGGGSSHAFKIIAVDHDKMTITVDFDTSSAAPMNGLGPDYSNWYSIGFVHWLQVGNSEPIPIGSVSSPFHYYFTPRTLVCWRYDKGMNCWLNGSAADVGIIGPPIMALIQMCNECGVNPWFCVVYTASDCSGNAPTAQEFMERADWLKTVAEMCKGHLLEGITPIFEGPNETWNIGFASTRYAWARQHFRNPRAGPWQSADWYGQAISLIGQTVAHVYGYTTMEQIRAQRQYRVVLGTWAADVPHGSDCRIKLRAPFYVQNTNPNMAAYRWITDVSITNYVNSPYYGEGEGGWVYENCQKVIAKTYFANPEANRYLIEKYVAAADVDEEWDPNKQYNGPKPDGTSDVVWDPTPYNFWGQVTPWPWIAKRPSINKKPTQNPDNWARAGNCIQLTEHYAKKLAEYCQDEAQWGPGLRMMAYEGGWCPEWSASTITRQLNSESTKARSLQHVTEKTHRLWLEVLPGRAEFPSEFEMSSGQIYGTFRADIYGNVTGAWAPGGPDGMQSPRWLGVRDINEGVRPPPIVYDPEIDFTEETIVPAGFVGSTAMATTAPTAGTVLTLTKEALSGIGNSGTLGIITFAAGSLAAQFGNYNADLSHMHSGDRVTLNPPTPEDATLRGVAWSLVTDRVRLPIKPPDHHASVREPAKSPHPPSWCHGLNHPNLSVCGPVHTGGGE